MSTETAIYGAETALYAAKYAGTVFEAWGVRRKAVTLGKDAIVVTGVASLLIPSGPLDAHKPHAPLFDIGKPAQITEALYNLATAQGMAEALAAGGDAKEIAINTPWARSIVPQSLPEVSFAENEVELANVLRTPNTGGDSRFSTRVELKEDAIEAFMADTDSEFGSVLSQLVDEFESEITDKKARVIALMRADDKGNFVGARVYVERENEDGQIELVYVDSETGDLSIQTADSNSKCMPVVMPLTPQLLGYWETNPTGLINTQDLAIGSDLVLLVNVDTGLIEGIMDNSGQMQSLAQKKFNGASNANVRNAPAGDIIPGLKMNENIIVDADPELFAATYPDSVLAEEDGIYMMVKSLNGESFKWVAFLTDDGETGFIAWERVEEIQIVEVFNAGAIDLSLLAESSASTAENPDEQTTVTDNAEVGAWEGKNILDYRSGYNRQIIEPGIILQEGIEPGSVRIVGTVESVFQGGEFEGDNDIWYAAIDMGAESVTVVLGSEDFFVGMTSLDVDAEGNPIIRDESDSGNMSVAELVAYFEANMGVPVVMDWHAGYTDDFANADCGGDPYCEKIVDYYEKSGTEQFLATVKSSGGARFTGKLPGDTIMGSEFSLPNVSY